MDWLSWFWSLAPHWAQQVLEIIGIFLVLYVIALFLMDSARIADASEERVWQGEKTNDLLRDIFDFLSPDDSSDALDDNDESDGTYLEEQVLMAFNADPILCDRWIDIEERAFGLIELTGWVYTEEEGKLAFEIARKVPGVTEVINLTTIIGEPEPGVEAEADGPLPGLEDITPPDIKTDSAVFHSIPGQVGKIRD